MARLDQDEFELTMDDDTKLAGESDAPCLDFWPYIDSLDQEALEGLTHQFSVDFFFRNSVRELEHVMIRTDLPYTAKEHSGTTFHHLWACSCTGLKVISALSEPSHGANEGYGAPNTPPP